MINTNLKQVNPVACNLITETENTVSFNAIRSPTNMFNVNLVCTANDTICKKVEKAFEYASNIVSSYIIFNTPIVLNASFTSFCGDTLYCSDSLTLGLGAPSRWLLMQDDDGVQRLYPQALVKQFQLQTHLEYDQFDMFVSFNSDQSYWFEGDPPIMPDQYDFLYLMIHEIHHGLGFGSAWDEYYARILTPLPARNPISGGEYDINSVDPNNGDKINFYEFAFDKYIILLSNGTKTSTISSILNEFFTGGSDTLSDFYNKFPGSPQYAYALEMYQIAEKPKTLGFLPQKTSNISESIILETSIYPYMSGSSISHVDNATYTNTSDFLMRATVKSGVTLTQDITAGGNYTLGPIGPKLKWIMETMGYKTIDNPNPYIPQVVKNLAYSSSHVFKPWNFKFNIGFVITVSLFAYMLW